MKELIIQPRQTGKTTWLLEKRKDIFPDWQYVCIGTTQAAQLKEMHNIKSKFITIKDCCHQLQYDYVNYKQTTFLLDEYFLYPKKEREYITKYLINNNCNFIAISTPDKLYNRDLIDSIKYWRQIQNDPCKYKPYIVKTEKQLAEDYGNDIVYNLISYPEVEVKYWEDTLLNKYGREKYETDILGKVYE